MDKLKGHDPQQIAKTTSNYKICEKNRIYFEIDCKAQKKLIHKKILAQKSLPQKKPSFNNQL
jgi:hypothetical protein